MPPLIALTLWATLLVALLVFDPARDRDTSAALWVPVIWLFIAGTRNPSQWLGGQVASAAAAYQDGNPLDRAILAVLILLAIVTLTSRSFSWGGFFTNNPALMAFLCFALISVTWSDFPLISLKRWIRDLGAYLTVLVVLTERRQLAAVSTLLRRLGYLFIPLSIVLCKYFPDIGMQYDGWTGARMFVGLTTSKNMLGLLCLVSGVYFFWDLTGRWHDRKKRETRKILFIDGTFLFMTIWLMHFASSTTSNVCLAMGWFVIVAARMKAVRRKSSLFKIMIPATFLLYLILDLGLGMNGSMAQALGKDPTLTDRSAIWAFLLGMHTNPVIGTGYQGFWLGPRLEWFWENSQLGHINEAHNGYLEIYLELGAIGIAVLVTFLISAYLNIWRKAKSSWELTVLGLALWIVLAFYNMSEAAFEAGLLYTVFLLAAVRAPQMSKVKAQLAVGSRSTHRHDVAMASASRSGQTLEGHFSPGRPWQ